MERSPGERRILNFNLFGESADLPDVVHCETIEARSRLHEWEFAPHRHARLHQVLHVEQGGGTANLEGVEYALGPGSLVNVPTGDVHGFTFMTGTEGHVVTFAAEMIDQTLSPAEGLRPLLSRADVVPAGPDVAATMRAIFAEYAGRGFARAHVLRSLSATLLGLAARALADGAEEQGGQGDPVLLRRFEALVEIHFLDHWGVGAYADALAVTPTHLTRLARTATGRPASQLIEDRLVREARRNLVFTNLPVATIAYSLGFADPAYFSRVFSRATGMSPSAFRERAGQPLST